MAANSHKTTEQCRLALAGVMLERLDIARHLLRLDAVATPTALALQLLERVADDIAELVGDIEEPETDAERREREAIRRAAGLPPRG